MVVKTFSESSTSPGLEGIAYFDFIREARREGNCETIDCSVDGCKIKEVQDTEYSLREYMEKISKVRDIEEFE